MDLVYKCIGKNLVVKFMNELDHHETKTLKGEIDGIIDNNDIRNIVFDFVNIKFMDSSGIGFIMGRYNKLEGKGGKIYIVNVDENLNEIFKISGLYNVTEKYDSVGEVLEKI